jgi:hypothetical protein
VKETNLFDAFVFDEPKDPIVEKTKEPVDVAAVNQKGMNAIYSDIDIEIALLIRKREMFETVLGTTRSI